DSPRSRRNTTSRLRATLQRWPGPNGPIVDGFGVIPGKPVVSVDGLRPPSLTTGAAATSARSISGLMDIITPVSSLTNSCPEKPGAAHRGHEPRPSRLRRKRSAGVRGPLSRLRRLHRDPVGAYRVAARKPIGN